MPRVLVSDTVSDKGLAILKNSPALEVTYKPGLKEDELAAEIPAYEALVIRSGSKVTAKVLAAATKLKVIGRAGIGVDNVDVPAASKRGIVVMNTPTGNAVTTAEHAITLVVSLARRIPQATASMKAGKWEKTKFSGRELAGKTLGVLGLGNIGRIVADRAKGLKMNVVAYDPVLTADRAAALGVELLSLDELWARADVITAHTPLTAETKGIVDDAAIAKMKKGVLLVNCARGGIYDEAALLRGLESGKLGGVALDVFVEEPPKNETSLALIKHDLVVSTPHLGASTEEAQERVVLEIAEQVVAYLTSGTIQNAVNVPSVSGDVAQKLAPYLDLAGKLGALLAQAGGGEGARSFEFECTGEAATLGSTALMNAALAGWLGKFMETGVVNAVSAPVLAQDRGLEVKKLTSTTPAHKGFATLVSLRVKDGQGKTFCAEGTLAHDGTPRLTSLMGHDLDAHLSPNLLVIENDDRPGVIGAIGTILGKRSINVSRMQVGLDAKTKKAVAIWSCDSAIGVDALGEVRGVGGVSRALAVSL
ncbi:MAG: phosphoglycerate dehydrogenase [Polyangiales bacterium]